MSVDGVFDWHRLVCGVNRWRYLVASPPWEFLLTVFYFFFFKFLLCSIGESCCLSTQTFECLIVNCTSFAFRWHGALAQPLTFLHKRPSDSTLRYGFSIQMCGGKSSSQQVSQHHRFAFRRSAFFWPSARWSFVAVFGMIMRTCEIVATSMWLSLISSPLPLLCEKQTNVRS